jgi:hypothetical protein
MGTYSRIDGDVSLATFGSSFRRDDKPRRTRAGAAPPSTNFELLTDQLMLCRSSPETRSLANRLGEDSSTSSRPPSSDDPYRRGERGKPVAPEKTGDPAEVPTLLRVTEWRN